jgi:hypothetical protein
MFVEHAFVYAVAGTMRLLLGVLAVRESTTHAVDPAVVLLHAPQ